MAFFEQLPIKKARRVVIGIIGGTVLLLGVALLVLPGPAFIVIPTGLAILATEFVWAKHLLRHIRDRMRWQRGTNGPPESPTQCETDQHHRR